MLFEQFILLLLHHRLGYEFLLDQRLVARQRALRAAHPRLLGGELYFELHGFLLCAEDALLQRMALDGADAGMLLQLMREAVATLLQLCDSGGLHLRRGERAALGRQDEQRLAARDALSFLDMFGDYGSRAGRIDLDDALARCEITRDVRFARVLSPEGKCDHSQCYGERADGEKRRGERADQRDIAEAFLARRLHRFPTEQSRSHAASPDEPNGLRIKS